MLMSAAKELMNATLMGYAEIILVPTRAIARKVIQVKTSITGSEKQFKKIKETESIVNSMICALTWSALKIKYVGRIKYHWLTRIIMVFWQPEVLKW